MSTIYIITCSLGDEGIRTPDLLRAKQAFSQLNYVPVCWLLANSL